MSNIIFKVENCDAERLWSYLLAYRRITRKAHIVTVEKAQYDDVALGVMPTLEQTTRASKPKRSVKKHSN